MAGNGTISGKNAKIRVNAQTTAGDVLEAADWSITGEASEVDDTTFEDGGYGTLTVGVVQKTINIKGFWNPTTNPHASPLTINEGAVLSYLKLYCNDTTGKVWVFPTVKITNVVDNAVVRGGITLEFTCKSSGTYTAAT